MTAGERMALLSGMSTGSALDHFKAINVGQTVVALGATVAASGTENIPITRRVGNKEVVFIVTRRKTSVLKTADSPRRSVL